MGDINDTGTKFDAYINKLLTDGGVPLVDKDGNAVLDEDNKPVLGPIPASILNVINSRLKVCGVIATPASQRAGDKVRGILAKIGASGKMPPLSEEPDAATA